jgi:hypothetical protein
MKEPSNGPIVRIANHHEAGVPFPIAETLAITVSKRMIGSELAMAMMRRQKLHPRRLRFRHNQPSLTIRGTQQSQRKAD